MRGFPLLALCLLAPSGCISNTADPPTPDSSTTEIQLTSQRPPHVVGCDPTTSISWREESFYGRLPSASTWRNYSIVEPTNPDSMPLNATGLNSSWGPVRVISVKWHDVETRAALPEAEVSVYGNGTLVWALWPPMDDQATKTLGRSFGAKVFSATDAQLDELAQAFVDARGQRQDGTNSRMPADPYQLFVDLPLRLDALFEEHQASGPPVEEMNSLAWENWTWWFTMSWKEVRWSLGPSEFTLRAGRLGEASFQHSGPSTPSQGELGQVLNRTYQDFGLGGPEISQWWWSTAVC